MPGTVQARLVRSVDPEAAAALGRIAYAPVAVVATAWAKDAFPRPPDGFGVLHARGAVGAVEGAHGVLGTLFTSCVFPEQGRPDEHLLRTILGGAVAPEVVELDDQALLGRVTAALSAMLGTPSAPPRLVRVYRKPMAIPQYAVGHLEGVAVVRAAQGRHPGLLRGNHLQGIGVKDCARAGEEAAAAVGARLRAPEAAERRVGPGPVLRAASPACGLCPAEASRGSAGSPATSMQGRLGAGVGAGCPGQTPSILPLRVDRAGLSPASVEEVRSAFPTTSGVSRRYNHLWKNRRMCMTGRVAAWSGLLVVGAVGCNREVTHDFPDGLEPIAENEAPWPSSRDTDELRVVVGESDADGGFSYAHGRGYVQADLETVFAAGEEWTTFVDRRAVNAWDVTWDTEPEYEISYTIYNEVEDLVVRVRRGLAARTHRGDGRRNRHSVRCALAPRRSPGSRSST